ncbi:autotransporter assembly complex protein TamA [Pelistega europaea]|uniref:BamA/TamA family outer membrane protein n=1 Tax=Pelistega europaea TaxID=106147 RepID=A0A7Y4P5R1_9BURK|nr:BamA/TamA family outer membrane protein [Pelistega europaea]NOL49124.1 BamA/TamA family outer membrane protein [Pelistega europaea]
MKYFYPIWQVGLCITLGVGTAYAAESSAQSSSTTVKRNNVPEVIIDPSGLPPDVLTAVQKAIAAVVRQADDQDSGEADRIRRKGHDAVLSALATKGYFSPHVRLEVGEDIGGDTWEISIDAGAISKVRTANNVFVGRIADSDYANRVKELKSSWGLPEGKDFINENWSSAKAALLDKTQEQDFFLARMIRSQAVVHPEQAQVDTITMIDSGPEVTLGKIEVLGLKRVPESIIHRYVQYEPGERYSQAQLDEWQTKLQSTNYFRGVFVNLKVPPGDEIYAQKDAQLPVTVKVTEAPAREVTASLGVDDSVGVRGEVKYLQRIVAGLPVTMETGIGADFKNQRAYLDFYLPPNNNGSIDSLGIMTRHTDIEGEEVLRYGAGWRRQRVFNFDAKSRVEYESSWSLMANYDYVKRDTDEEKTKFHLPTLVATYDLLRRDVDDKYNPRSGNLIAIGGGIGRDLKNKEYFSRASARAQVWIPVGKRDVFTVRAEVGKVWAKDSTLIPDDFGYRTGGARTIRGYRYFGIGEKVGKAVIGTRALAVASMEYMHYFNDTFGMGLFVDVGDAAPSFKEMKMHVGYGVGALIKTPAGPLNLDVAYGQRDRKIRLHFSLGMAF